MRAWAHLQMEEGGGDAGKDDIEAVAALMRIVLAALLLSEQESQEEHVLDLTRSEGWPHGDRAWEAYKPPDFKLGNYAALARLAGVRQSPEMNEVIQNFTTGFSMGYEGPHESKFVHERHGDDEKADTALRAAIAEEVEAGWLTNGIRLGGAGAGGRVSGSGALAKVRRTTQWDARASEQSAPAARSSQDDTELGYRTWHGARLPHWVEFVRVSPVRALEKSAMGVPQAKYRVIQNLSHGKVTNDSINSHIYLDEMHLVRFRDILASTARAGEGSLIWKRDKKSAFRMLPLDRLGVFLTAFVLDKHLYFNFRMTMGAKKSVEQYQGFGDQNKRLNMILMRPRALVSPRGAVHGGLCEPNEAKNWAAPLLAQLGDADQPRRFDSAQDAYIDDAIGHGYTKGTVRAWLEYASYMVLCLVWGLPVSADKSEPPGTRRVVLGLEIDSATMTVSVPEKRLKRLKSYLSNWAEKDEATKRELQELVGQLQFACNATQHGHSFLRRLIEAIKQRKFLDDNITLDSDAKAEIRMWKQFVGDWNGVSIIIDPLPVVDEQILLEMDACPLSGGAVYKDRWFFVDFVDETQQDWHISIKEMYMAVAVALTFKEEFRGRCIRLRSDNEATVDLLNTGRNTDNVMMALYRELLLTSIEYSFRFTGVWIAGLENKLADAASRKDKRHLMWALRPTLERNPCAGVLPTLRH